MELTKYHRSALLHQLHEAKAHLVNIEKLFDKPVIGTEHVTEIDQYLTKQRIEVIENALIENEIDY